jgi:hypothetical protein
MEKKKLKKGKASSKLSLSKPEKSEGGKPSEQVDRQMDFGGIPARDVKKNLGCG